MDSLCHTTFLISFNSLATSLIASMVSLCDCRTRPLECCHARGAVETPGLGALSSYSAAAPPGTQLLLRCSATGPLEHSGTRNKVTIVCVNKMLKQLECIWFTLFKQGDTSYIPGTSRPACPCPPPSLLHSGGIPL